MNQGDLSSILDGRPIRVLVVDDSEDDAHLLYSELTARGERIDYRRVDDAPSMAAAVNVEEWDLIICDHHMPRFDSMEALEVLKQSGKDIPFIIYSGTISDRQATSAMGCGVCDYIEKGNFDRLVPVIEREIRGASARFAVRRADDRLKRLAYYDSLSNLPNRDLFCRRVSEFIDEARVRGKEASGALYYLDIDHFRRINCSFGYASGNEVLKQVARRLAECADQTVTVAKLGGDEFGVFWPHVTDDRAAAELASAIERVFDAPFSVGTVDIGLTPSIGMALTPEDGADVYGLLTNAETATAIVKRGGGNGFRRYSREWGAGSAERIAVEADLRHALERNQLVPKFGPVFRTADKRIAAVELTTSWAHPVRGLLAPDLFMSVADESGYSNGIEDWGLRKACEFGRSLHDAGGGDTCVSVRVSARRLSQPGLLRAISEVTEITGFSPTLLEIEISESALVSAAEAGIGVLCALKKFGVKLCVGSSGTGYSSLSIPRRLPIDIVKMNRSLVRDVATDQEAEAVARAILTLSRSLGRMTTAEGVESEAQFRFLRDEGCDRVQGDYLSPPLEVESCSALFLAERDAAVPSAE